MGKSMIHGQPKVCARGGAQPIQTTGLAATVPVSCHKTVLAKAALEADDALLV